MIENIFLNNFTILRKICRNIYQNRIKLCIKKMLNYQFKLCKSIKKISKNYISYKILIFKMCI